MTATIAWALGLGVLGAIVGSFLATLVVRWPEGRSVIRGRSACDGCGKVLGPAALVPLVSAAALRGRCAACAAPIDPRHWRIELAAMTVGAAAGMAAPGADGVAGAVFGWLLLTLAALDLTEWWLPDRLTALLAGAGIATGFAGIAPDPGERLIGGALGFGSLWAIATGYRLARGRAGMGGGDPKLLGAIGLWLGWRMLPPTLLLASAAGLAMAIGARARGRSVGLDTAVPFGALLAIAAYVVWLGMLVWV